MFRLLQKLHMQGVEGHGLRRTLVRAHGNGNAGRRGSTIHCDKKAG